MASYRFGSFDAEQRHRDKANGNRNASGSTTGASLVALQTINSPPAAGEPALAAVNDEGNADSSCDNADFKFRIMASRIYQARRDREKYFDSDMLADPVWDMLLAAYCLPTASRPLTVKGLCHASACPYSTAFRWMDCMVDRGLLERRSSELDKRVIFVSLTPLAREKVENYLSRHVAHYAVPELRGLVQT